MHWTLGIGVSRDHSSHTISLSQEAYIYNLVERFGLQNAAIVTTPLAPGAILTKDQCPATAEELRVGESSYVSNPSSQGKLPLPCTFEVS